MIYYKLWNPAGIINQLMSIELAVGIKHITESEITIYNTINGQDRSSPIFSSTRLNNKKNNLLDDSRAFLVSDILNWKDKDSYIMSEDRELSLGNEYKIIDNLMKVYCDLKNEQYDSEFSEGREQISLSDNMHIQYTLGWYSRFFKNRTKELDESISSVRFLPEYYELSEQIAKSLGSFNGAHLRLTDHKDMFDPDNNVIDSGISKIDNSLPIILCTDQPDSELIKNSSYNYLMLDDYILNNFYKEFREFKFKEEVSFGILNNLVMHHSQDFIGSPGSTYTGYIHRGLNQKRDIQWKIFGEEEHIQDGPYSWNGYNSRDTSTKQFWREWKESKICMI